MVRDYYSILGVAPDASPEVLRLAYRERASRCHPDHGGSHDQMVLVNQAWVILSDPATRRSYDESRVDNPSRAAREKAEADAAQARKDAERYARRWDEFVAGLDHVFKDIARAEYGSTKGMGMEWPTAGNSVSGCLFIAVGGVLGFVLLVPILAGIFQGIKPPKFLALAILLGPIWVGAWAGSAIHSALGQAILGKNVQAATPPTESSPEEGLHGACPRCGFTFGWDGSRCRHCHHRG